MTTKKVQQFNAALKIAYDFWLSDKGIGGKRDRVLLGGMQRAVNLCSTSADTMGDEYEFMKPGDPRLYPSEIEMVTGAFVQLITEWQNQVNAVSLTSTFIDDNTKGIYIIVVEPRLDGIAPIEVKVGKTTKPAHRLMTHKNNWRYSVLLDYLPLYQSEFDSLETFEPNAHIYAAGIMTPIAGTSEKFHAKDVNAAEAFARRARVHYIK